MRIIRSIPMILLVTGGLWAFPAALYAACSAAPTASTSDAMIRFKNPAAYAQVIGIASPGQGDLVYDTTNSALKLCDGTNWNTIGGTVSGSSGYVQFNSSGSFGSDSNFYWNNSSKRLGIGTAVPASTLSVYTSGIAGLVTRGFSSFYFPNSSLYSGGFQAYKAAGTSDSPTAVANSDNLGSFSIGGYDGSQWITTVAVSGNVNGAVSANTVPTDMVFYTGPNLSTGASTEKMRITSGGNVGIGTTTMTGMVNINAPSTQTAANAYGLYVNGAQSTANTSGYYGIEVAPNYTAGSGNTLAVFSAVRGNPQNSGTGTVTSMSGLYSLPRNTSSGTVESIYGVLAIPQNTSTGTVTTMMGLYGRCDNTNAGGTVTSCYALYLATPTTTGAITNKYGVYQIDSNSLNYFAGNVGIGTTTMTGKVNINAPSTQTAANAYGLYVNGAQSTANSSNNYGITVAPTYTATSGNTLAGLVGVNVAPQNASTGTVTIMQGMRGAPDNGSSGTVGTMYGVLGLTMNSSTGTTTAMTALYGRCDNTNASGTVTTCYGLYLATPTTTGVITNKYGVYQQDSNSLNYFAGNVGIGTTTPQSTLHVPDGKYAQFEDNNAGAPTAADCDSNTERGRLSIDTTNNRLYVCNGATRGWDYIALTD